MKKILAVLAVLFFGVGVAFAVDYPVFQGRMVNDFASVLTDSVAKERIEQKLRDFKKRTTNELVVAIVQDMQGENVDAYAVNLFKEWGIGKKDKNNGILLFVAVKERKMRIEVGYGLEEKLTDLASGRIVDNIITPAFKKKDFAGGIEQAVDEMMNIVAPKVLTAEEQMARAKQAKIEQVALMKKQKLESEKVEKIKKVLAITFSILAIIGSAFVLIYLLVGKIKKSNAEKERIRNIREKMSLCIKEGVAKLADFLEKKKLCEKILSEVPHWMRDEKTHQFTVLVAAINMFEEIFKQMQDALDGKFESYDLRPFTFKVESQSKIICDLIESIEQAPDEADKLRKNAQDAIAEVKQLLMSAEKMQTEMTKEGFLVQIGEDLKLQSKTLKVVENDFAKDSDPAEATFHADRLKTTVESLVALLKKTSNARSEAISKLAGLPKNVAHLNSRSYEVNLTLGVLKTNHPSEVWTELDAAFSMLKDKFAEINKLVEAATEKSSMECQNFSEAVDDLWQAEKIAREIDVLFNLIKGRYVKAQDAKKDFQKVLSSAKSNLALARERIDYDDVKPERRRAFDEVEEEINSAEKLASAIGVVNWIVIVATLTAASESASKILKLVVSDISSAESARAKKLLHAQQEVARQKKSQENNNSGIGFSGVDASRNDNADVDLGGGRSGGAGAAGEW